MEYSPATLKFDVKECESLRGRGFEAREGHHREKGKEERCTQFTKQSKRDFHKGGGQKRLAIRMLRSVS